MEASNKSCVAFAALLRYDLCYVSFSNCAKKSVNQSNHPRALSSSPTAELLSSFFFILPVPVILVLRRHKMDRFQNESVSV